MIQISQSDKERMIQFIKENELDYIPVDNGIIKFHTMSYDGMKFFFYNVNEDYLIVKYDPNKDNGNPASIPYEYYTFKNLQQVLEQLSFYDNSLYKQWWSFTNPLEVKFEKETYDDKWYEDFKKGEFWSVEETNQGKVLVYENSSYKPELKSPHNTIHEVSPINEVSYEKVNKLYFEIHPLSCLEGRESYLLKLLCNNEEVLKEYINYRVVTKKGLRLLVSDIFKNLERYKS